MPATTRVLLLAASLAGATACGKGSPQDLTPGAARLLQADSARVAAAARAHDVTRLRPALQQLRSDVAAQQRRGSVGGARAQRILDAASLIAQDVPPQATPTSRPTSTLPPSSRGVGDDGGNQEGDDGG